MAEVIIPYNERGNPLTPIEAETRMPLPIWAPGEGKTDRHHAHYYKEDFENGPLHVRAVRYSRLQRVRKRSHKLHHDAFDGALLPRNEQEAFTITVLSCAGYIPHFAVDLTSMEPEIIEVTPAMKRVLKEPGTFVTERKLDLRADIGQFLMNYAIWQDFDEDEMSDVEQFLAITEQQVKTDEVAAQRKLSLGLRLTDRAIEVAVDPINDEYNRARHEDALRDDAPACASLAVKEFVKGHESAYFDTLEQNLRLTLAA